MLGSNSKNPAANSPAHLAVAIDARDDTLLPLLTTAEPAVNAAPAVKLAKSATARFMTTVGAVRSSRPGNDSIKYPP